MLFLVPDGVLGRFFAAAALLASLSGCVAGPSRPAQEPSLAAQQPSRPGAEGTRAARVSAAPPRPLAARSAAESDAAPRLERDAIVALAVERSPTLAMMAHRARALVHASHAEGALPPAEVGVAAWNLPLTRPYALGEADMYMVELRQQFPVMGALDARARAMAEEAQGTLAELSTEERLVAERAANAFADYVQAHAEKRLQERQLALLSRMSQAVGARFTTGGSGLTEAARINVEVTKVQRGLARIEGDITRSRATLNTLLRRPAGAALGEPQEAPAETVRLTVEELFTRANSKRGTTLAAEARLRAAGARREAAEAEASVPEFMVGLGYWQVPSMRPGLGLSASMSLPWLWGPSQDRVRQSEEEEAAERAARDGAELDAQSEIGEAHAQIAALEAQLAVIQQQALPATSRSMDALTAAYSTGNASILEWVDVARSLLELEMETVVLRGDLQRAVAGLERAVGTQLPRTPLQ